MRTAFYRRMQAVYTTAEVILDTLDRPENPEELLHAYSQLKELGLDLGDNIPELVVARREVNRRAAEAKQLEEQRMAAEASAAKAAAEAEERKKRQEAAFTLPQAEFLRRCTLKNREDGKSCYARFIEMEVARAIPVEESITALKQELGAAWCRVHVQDDRLVIETIFARSFVEMETEQKELREQQANKDRARAALRGPTTNGNGHNGHTTYREPMRKGKTDRDHESGAHAQGEKNRLSRKIVAVGNGSSKKGGKKK